MGGATTAQCNWANQEDAGVRWACLKGETAKGAQAGF